MISNSKNSKMQINSQKNLKIPLNSLDKKHSLNCLEHEKSRVVSSNKRKKKKRTENLFNNKISKY